MFQFDVHSTYSLYPVKEIYRIKLPGPAKLGEGKPENQNHAIIFTRGEALQTIDMNQVKLSAYGTNHDIFAIRCIYEFSSG